MKTMIMSIKVLKINWSRGRKVRIKRKRKTKRRKRIKQNLMTIVLRSLKKKTMANVIYFEHFNLILIIK